MLRVGHPLDQDAVFGVQNSLVTQFERHEPGIAPDGRTMDRPFRTLSYDFVLAGKAGLRTVEPGVRIVDGRRAQPAPGQARANRRQGRGARRHGSGSVVEARLDASAAD